MTRQKTERQPWRNTSGLKRGGGRPKGTPNKATQEAKAFSRDTLSDAAYIESLQRRLKAGKAPHMEVLLWHYAHGKPKETTEYEGEVRLVIAWQSPSSAS